MEVFNNTTKIIKDDLVQVIKPGSRVSIAAACFSIYAYRELKAQLQKIDSMRFIFTSPTFVTEKSPKKTRVLHSQVAQERSLYGTEFEVKLRNELTQKLLPGNVRIGSWKVAFKSNATQGGMGVPQRTYS